MEGISQCKRGSKWIPGILAVNGQMLILKDENYYKKIKKALKE
jgi:hypothetical protein